LPAELVVGERFERAEDSGARVVDQDVEAARFGQRPAQGLLAGGGVGQVERDGMEAVELRQARRVARGAPGR